MNKQSYRNALEQVKPGDEFKDRIISQFGSKQRIRRVTGWRPAVQIISAALICGAIAIGGWQVIRPHTGLTQDSLYAVGSESGNSTASLGESEIGIIPQYEFDGKIYQVLDGRAVTPDQVGASLGKSGDTEFFAYQPANSPSHLLVRQGDTFQLCQFTRSASGHISGSEILSLFKGNGEISSIVIHNYSDRERIRTEKGLINQFVQELSTLSHTDTPRFDHSVPDQVTESSVSHQVTLFPACQVQYENGFSFELFYESATGLLEGFGSSYSPTETLSGLLELS